MLDPAIFEQWAEAIVAINQYAAAKADAAVAERNFYPTAGYSRSTDEKWVKDLSKNLSGLDTASLNQVVRNADARSLANHLLADHDFVSSGTLEGISPAILEQAMKSHAGELSEFGISVSNALLQSNSHFRVRMFLRTGRQGLYDKTVDTYCTEILDSRTNRRVDGLRSTVNCVSNIADGMSIVELF